MIRSLSRVIEAAPGKPVRPEAVASQAAARALAEDPGSWSGDAAREVVRRYTELAPVWDGERGGYRPVPLTDALARGGPWPAGLCVEVGCGTGLLTPRLAGVWPDVLCLDLTQEMIRRSTAPRRVVADAACLPVGDRAAAAVVLGDAPLFAGEVTRVLARDGVVVWSNALGTDAPHHVPVDTVATALGDADGSEWDAVSAEAGWGLWAVLRRT
ncbi:methyltransferase domain-containing protein [Actinophytocola sp.]|jgi:SAM-dependent methyltransferase|uniref:methyltransferase domain-containing protein n=1 Tax=Actinophytocola sp. TaxID=1872138 RepID=UPI002ED956D4